MSGQAAANFSMYLSTEIVVGFLISFFPKMIMIMIIIIPMKEHFLSHPIQIYSRLWVEKKQHYYETLMRLETTRK